MWYSDSKIDKSQQDVYYWDIFLEFDDETKSIFKNAIEEIQKEKIKLQNYAKNTINKMMINFSLTLVLFSLVMLFFHYE